MNAVIVGWGHTRFGRLEGLSLEDLIVEAASAAMAEAGIEGEAEEMQIPSPNLGLCFNMGGGAVASYVSILEAVAAGGRT